MKLFFDTETSGKADFKAPASDPKQPRLVQLAAMLTTDKCDPISQVKLLVKPDGWRISPDSTNVHGITNEHATLYGLPVSQVLYCFLALAYASKSIHAFNIQFDRLIMESELHRAKRPHNPFVERECICEMEAMTPICKLPPRFPGAQYKWPSLTEAYTHFFNCGFGNAHDAMADVQAMIKVHFQRISLKEINLL